MQCGTRSLFIGPSSTTFSEASQRNSRRDGDATSADHRAGTSFDDACTDRWRSAENQGTVARVARVVRSCVGAPHSAPASYHSRCDLKCNQILVSEEDVAMLADFGLSFVSADSRPLTPSGAVRWKAPDVAVVFQVKRGVALPRPKAFVDNEQWQFV
ncbi:hypothetical protein JG687_00013876 [Phytophthora cactorum]|uniref:Protein kinase domain-containing protein n=1 Tax=Phytophthora cactorum TaxID=29920 RepID=A0A8T1U2C8_9STRA|nr:hypothetical protein JG687_00013876 [Phytophthora cactorum]